MVTNIPKLRFRIPVIVGASRDRILQHIDGSSYLFPKEIFEWVVHLLGTYNVSWRLDCYISLQELLSPLAILFPPEVPT